MNEKVITIESMQADHQDWLAAYAQWRQDIERWQKEHESAVARIAEMQKVVRDHGECLVEHARTFQQAEAATTAHEHEIALFLAGTSENPQDVVANRHQEQEGVFSQQKSAHERIKKHHDAVMTKLKALESAAAAAM